MALARAADIHRFWFGNLSAAGLADATQRARWFAQDDAFDQEISERFLETMQAAQQQQLLHWLDTPATWLSYLLLCDQFPRNVYRGSAAAFSTDSLALAAAHAGISRKFHLQLCIDEQAFAYLPFEHSEQLLDQYIGAGLFCTLRDQADKSNKAIAGNYLRHAQQHRDIILQFGRFPHRNAALQRESTAAELRYLSQAGAFAQSS